MSTQLDDIETLYYADQSDLETENESRISISQTYVSSLKSNIELLENESFCCCNIL
jgi:hypothetical protein